MRKSRSSQRTRQNESGQVLLEFILALIIVVISVSIFVGGMRSMGKGFWRFFCKEVTAPCPGCTPADPCQ